MSLPSTNVSISAIKSELGISSPNTVSGLVANSNVNAWSFWSPRALYFDTSDNKILKPQVVPSAPYKLGDFRLYNHSATEPYVEATASEYLANPSDATKTILIDLNNGEANILRAGQSGAGEPAGVRVQFYKNYSGGILSNPVGSAIYIPFTDFGPNGGQNALSSTIRGIDASTALPGHVVNETQTIAAAGSQPATFAADYSINADGGITSTLVTRYAEVVFMNAGDLQEVGRYATHVASFGLRKLAQPEVYLTTASWSPNPFPDVDGSHMATAVFGTELSQTHTAGATSWNFSFKVAAAWQGSGIQTRLSGNVQVRYVYEGSTYNIGSVRTFEENDTILVTNAITGGKTSITYDDEIEIELVFTNLTTSYDQ